MKSLLLFLLSSMLLLTSNEIEMSNYLTIKEIFRSLDKVQKMYLKLSDDSYIIYYLDDEEVKGVSRISMDREKEFYVDIDDRSYAENGSIDSFHDSIEVSYVTDSKGYIISKQVSEIFTTHYRFDHAGRLVSYKNEDIDILFFNRGDFLTKISSWDDRFEEKTIFMVDEYVLGEDSSFVLKDVSGNIILAVIDDVPYLTRIDEEGSIREIIDIETKEVVATVTFSKKGHIANSTGLMAMPFCFRGMYQEKVSEIYFDVNTYYDPDIGEYLAERP